MVAFHRVIVLLRLVGVTNAAVWLGATFLFSFVVTPAFSSSDMLDLMKHQYFPAAALHVLVPRFYVLMYVCTAIAFMHLVAEWLYAGKPIQRTSVLLLIGLTCLGLIGGLAVQPKLTQLHQIKHRTSSAPLQREAAVRAFSTWNGVSHVLNLLLVAGLFGYFWKVTGVEVLPRFVVTNKIRS